MFKENWEEGPSTSKNEIQYVMDLRESSMHWDRFHARICFRPRNDIKYYCFPRPAQNYSPSGKNPLWSHDGLGMMTTRLCFLTKEGGAAQIYPLNLRIMWNEVRPVSLVMSEFQAGTEGVKIKTIYTDVFSPLPGRTLLP